MVKMNIYICWKSNEECFFKTAYCKKLVLERHYTSAAFITSKSDLGLDGIYNEPAHDIGVAKFATALTANIGAFG